MARPLKKLSFAQIKNASSGKYSDGGGLWFHRRADGGAQWFVRYTLHGRRREMGLGAYPEVSLKEARDHAEKVRVMVRQGVDPIKDRERERREAQRCSHLLEDIVQDAFESQKSSLKGDGVNGRWLSPLENHVLPKLGKVPVTEIDQMDIRDMLAPIWHTKAPTAKKAMARLSICFRHAAALGLDVDLQVTDKAKALLGKQDHVSKPISSMPWQEVPAFYASLNDGTVTHLALRLVILTVLRSGPIRFMRMDQVHDGIWTIPGEDMKGKKNKTPEFRVPLSSEATAVFAEAVKFERDGFLFPSVRKGVISDGTMSQLMKRRGLQYRPHGFRTSLRNWMEETSDVPHAVAEACLAHVTGSKTERAYRRTDYLEQRQGIMEAWGEYVAGRHYSNIKVHAFNVFDG